MAPYCQSVLKDAALDASRRAAIFTAVAACTCTFNIQADGKLIKARHTVQQWPQPMQLQEVPIGAGICAVVCSLPDHTFAFHHSMSDSVISVRILLIVHCSKL